jgi:hypothetical protein
MAFYSLGNQGFYNAFAQAGQGIRGTIGDISSLYNMYKPGGTEDQRRAELLLQQQKGASDIKLQGAEAAGMTGEQQRAQDLFNYQKQFRPSVDQPDASSFQPGGTPPSIPQTAAPALGGQPSPPPAPADNTSPKSEAAGDGTLVGSSPGFTAQNITPGVGTPPQPAPGGGTLDPSIQPGPVAVAGDGTVTAHPSPTHPRAASAPQDEGMSLAPMPPPSPSAPAPRPMDNPYTPGPPLAPGGAAPVSAPVSAPAANPFPINFNDAQAAPGKSNGAVLAGGYGDFLRAGANLLPHVAWNAGKWLTSPSEPALNPTTPPALAPAAPSATPAPSPQAQSAPAVPPVSSAPVSPLIGTPAPPVAPSTQTPGTMTVDPQQVQGPVLFQELPPQAQQAFVQAWRQHQPGATVADAQTAFDSQVRSETGTMRRPATEQDLMMAMRIGVDPSQFIHNNVLDPLAEARALVPAYQNMLGPNSGGLWRFNPGTGTIEATPEGQQPSPVDPRINRLDQASLEKIRYETNQNPAVKNYAETAVPFESLQKLATLPKTTNNEDNDIISMAARVINPGGVVRPSSVEFEQSHPGIWTEVQRTLKGWTTGGKLSDSERAKILQASTATYKGLYDQYAQQRNIAMSQAQFAVDKGADPQRIESYMLGKPLVDLTSESGDQSQSSPGGQLPTISSPTDPAFKALPSGAKFVGPDGQVRVKN